MSISRNLPSSEVLHVLRRGQSNTMATDRKASLSRARNDPYFIDTVTPGPPLMVSSALSDSAPLGADLFLLPGFPG